jgi:ABC-type antimicrobial peptide transport system permease subunit
MEGETGTAIVNEAMVQRFLAGQDAIGRQLVIGIRMALGADGGDVARMVLGDGWRSVRIGLAAGLAASLLIAQAMTRWLYDVTAADPWVFGGVTALLAAVALLASWLPARRAARVDPMVCAQRAA